MELEQELQELWFDMRQVAFICQIKINNKTIGRNKIFELLRQNKVLQEGNNLPYKKYIEQGYFSILRDTVERVGQYNKETQKTLVSLKGIEFIKQFLIQK